MRSRVSRHKIEGRKTVLPDSARNEPLSPFMTIHIREPTHLSISSAEGVSTDFQRGRYRAVGAHRVVIIETPCLDTMGMVCEPREVGDDLWQAWNWTRFAQFQGPILSMMRI